MPIERIQTASLLDAIPPQEELVVDGNGNSAPFDLEDESADSLIADLGPDTLSVEEGMLAVIEGFVAVFPTPSMNQADHLAEAFELEGLAKDAFVQALMDAAYGPAEETSETASEDDTDAPADAEEEEDDTLEDLVHAAADDLEDADGFPIHADALTDALNNDGIEDHGEAPDDEAVQNDGEPDLPSKHPEDPTGALDGVPANPSTSSDSDTLGSEDGMSK